jgi:predicted dehydrogenase
MSKRMKNKIRVACIGTGYFSRFHYDAWQRIEDVNLIASVSLSIKEAQDTGLPAYDVTQTMLDETKPDLVDIITPPISHFDLIKQCAEGGVKTIICQKPFCKSLEEAKEAVAICKQYGTSLIVHENFRFQPWYRKMKQALDEGIIGDVHQLTFRLRTGDGQGADAYMDRQPYFQKMDKFLIHETGVHWIDTFRYLFGKPKAVYADLRQLNPHIAGEDAGYFIMTFADGKRALFDANRHLDHDTENCRNTLGEALLEGTKGTISLSGMGELTLREFGSRDSTILYAEKHWQGFAGDCVHALQSHVINAMQDDTMQFENTGEDYLRVIELEKAIYQSAKTGQKIYV